MSEMSENRTVMSGYRTFSYRTLSENPDVREIEIRTFEIRTFDNRADLCPVCQTGHSVFGASLYYLNLCSLYVHNNYIFRSTSLCISFFFWTYLVIPVKTSTGNAGCVIIEWCTISLSCVYVEKPIMCF